MKKVFVIFVILFFATLLIPMISMTKSSDSAKELVTIFSGTLGLIL